jgi:hypothetical protein
LAALATARRGAAADGWLALALATIACGGAAVDVARGGVGLPVALAAALGAAVAVHRLAALAVLVPRGARAEPSGPSLAGVASGPAASSGSPALTAPLTAGAILLALVAGFLVLAPVLLTRG